MNCTGINIFALMAMELLDNSFQPRRQHKDFELKSKVPIPGNRIFLMMGRYRQRDRANLSRIGKILTESEK
jgi:hypothetical protein